MSEMPSSRNADPLCRWRPAALVAGAAVVALTVSACGSTSGTRPGANGPNTPAKSCGRPTTDPYPGLQAAKAPSVTAGTRDQLPTAMPGREKPPVTIGTKDFAESVLVGQLYKTALEKKGYTVKLQPKIGPSEDIDAAFKSGKIDVYPEYLGEVVTSLTGNETQQSAKETYETAKKFEQAKRDATIFKQTPYENVDIMLVKPGFCRQNHLNSAADLKHVGTDGSGVTFTAQRAAKSRYAGFKGLQEVYGLTNAKFKGVSAGGQTIQAIENGEANVADGFSTTTSVVKAVQDGDLVALKDPKHIMGFQHVAPIVKQSVVTKEGPAFERTLNWVDAKLTLDVINKLNKQVQSDHVPAAKAAKSYLNSNGLQ